MWGHPLNIFLLHHHFFWQPKTINTGVAPPVRLVRFWPDHFSKDISLIVWHMHAHNQVTAVPMCITSSQLFPDPVPAMAMAADSTSWSNLTNHSCWSYKASVDAESNLVQLLCLRAEDNSQLDRSMKKNTSHENQNEMLEIMALHIMQKKKPFTKFRFLPYLHYGRWAHSSNRKGR